jgi:hypothetical protein
MERVESPASIKSKLNKEVSDHLNMVFSLSKDIGVDTEFIKMYYCCMLYALDYHGEAEKVKRNHMIYLFRNLFVFCCCCCFFKRII